MKTGKSLVQLAHEIERQKQAAQDILTPTSELTMLADGTLNIKGVAEQRGITPYAHDQIGARCGIPAKYYDRMLLEAPALLADNVNHWFREKPETRLLRSLDGRLRAFLSDRFQRIDNHHVANVVLPILGQVPQIEVMSCEITERRMYIKAVTHAVRQEIKSRRVGDFVEAGVIISNSEIGAGSLSVQPFFYFLACTNGMVRNKDGMRAYHVGRKAESDEVAAVLADDTRALEDKLVLNKVRDVLRAAMDTVQFGNAVAKMQASTEQRIEGSVPKAVELLGDTIGLTQGEQDSVLRHLIDGGDLSKYGLMNAVTRTAEDLPSYDRATELETFGGAVLDLPQRDWQRIALAA